MKHIIQFFAVITLSAFLSGCADLMETDSELVEFEEDNTLNHPTDTVYSVMGIIGKMQLIADRTVLLGEVRGDLLTTTDAANADLKRLAAFDVTPDNKYNVVSDYYAVINNCNYFIQHVDTTLQRRGRTIFTSEYAAVKAFRAWTYLQLALAYGEVPLVTDPVMTEQDAQKEMMAGSSFKSLKGLSWDDLRYLQVLHCDADGNAIVGEMVCNSIIANDLLDIFKTLYQAAYPIERMRLVEHYASDDEASMRNNNTSCFNQRASTAGGKVSEHSFGLAVDINPRYNPYFKVKASGKVIVRPEGSEEYLNREANSPYIIKKGDLCYRLFKQHGFQWGGDWASGKDYQHFERSQTSKRYE